MTGIRGVWLLLLLCLTATTTTAETEQPHPNRTSLLNTHHHHHSVIKMTEGEYVLLHDLEGCGAPAQYVNNIKQFICDSDSFPLSKQACRDANAALARHARRMSGDRRTRADAEQQKRLKREPAPELRIVDDLPEEISVPVGDPIRLEFTVTSLGEAADGGRSQFPVSFLWTKDILHAAHNAESQGIFLIERALLEDEGVYQCVCSNDDHAVFSRAVRVKVIPRGSQEEAVKTKSVEKTGWDKLERQYSLDACHGELSHVTSMDLDVPPVCDYAVTLCYGIQSELCGENDPNLKPEIEKRVSEANGDTKTETTTTTTDNNNNNNNSSSSETDCRANLHKCKYVVRDCFFQHTTESDKYNFASCFFSKSLKKIEVMKLTESRLYAINIQQDDGDWKCVNGFDQEKFHYRVDLPFDVQNIRLQLIPQAHGRVTDLEVTSNCVDVNGEQSATTMTWITSDTSKEAAIAITTTGGDGGVSGQLLSKGITPSFEVNHHCSYEVEITVLSQEGKEGGQGYSLAIHKLQPTDDCTIYDFNIDHLPFTFYPMVDYYAPLFVATNQSHLNFEVNQFSKTSTVRINQVCGAGWIKGNRVDVNMGANRFDLRLKTEANRECQLYTFIVHRLFPLSTNMLGSDQNTLEDLTVLLESGESVTIDPPFDPDWPIYHVTVGSEVKSVRLRAISEGTCHIEIDQCGWESGIGSPLFHLLPGNNKLTVTVTAENQRNIRRYLVFVNRRQGGMSVASQVSQAESPMLQRLELHLPEHAPEPLPLKGKLTSFARTVPAEATMAFLVVLTEFPNSQVEVNGDAVYNGHESGAIDKPFRPIKLLAGPNLISIAVFGEMAHHRTVYNLQLIRGFPEPKQEFASQECGLRKLEVAPFAMEEGKRWKQYEMPVYNSPDAIANNNAGSYVIEVEVAAEAEFFIVRGLASHPDAAITIEGDAVQNGDFSRELATPWSAKNDRESEETYLMTVTAEDTKTTATYELKVVKACPVGQFFDTVLDVCADCVEANKHSYPHLSNMFQSCNQVTCSSPCDGKCESCTKEVPHMCSNSIECSPHEERFGGKSTCGGDIVAQRVVCENHRKSTWEARS